jgi:ABC-type nickel/cobalt efflux system permease component RcnA
VENADVQYRILTDRLLAALLVSALAAGSALAVEVGATSAWKAQTQKFYYTGFKTYYSCDGLEDKVRQVLLADEH